MLPTTRPDDSGMRLAPVAVSGHPRVWLRLEAAAVLGLASVAYGTGSHSWGLFAALFFVPDISMLGYLAGPRVGAASYNLVHNYVVPIGVGVLLHASGRSFAIPLIWVAHIGFDRMMGYGLKYPTGFGDTHLGLLGEKNTADAEGDK
jgi:hypothetical protein